MIVFKEWLPDQPDLGNPGLIEAHNVLVADNGAYMHFPQPTAATHNGSTVGTIPSSLSAGSSTINSGIMYSHNEMFVASSNFIFGRVLGVGGPWSTASATISSAGNSPIRFARVLDSIIATCLGHTALASTRIDSGTSYTGFTTLSTSDTTPRAAVVGSVGQFAVLGNLIENTTGNAMNPSHVRWSAIGNPRDWPTPNSSTALASQAGQQDLGYDGGDVTAIHGGDQFAVVLQTSRITRMTYIGGTSVFQFDTISEKEGSFFEGGSIRVDDLTYFISRNGFKVTNGVSVEAIGHGKADRYFWETVAVDYLNDPANAKTIIWTAYDSDRKDIYWLYKTALGVPATGVIVYNVPTARFTRATVAGHYALMDFAQNLGVSNRIYLHCVDANRQLQFFAGAPSAATLTTGEVEGNPGGYSYVSGVKPVIDVTANAVTIAMGTRNDSLSSPSFTSEITVNSRSSFCDFRSEARYHRARVTIAGTFNSAQGLHVNASPSGQL